MSIISKCPKCHEQVTIPDGLDPEMEVRCPLCAVVYALREAIAEAPPALIPVETGAIQGPGPHSDALAKSDLVSERFHVPDADDISGPLGTEAEPPADEAPALDHWQEIDVAPEIDIAAADDPSPAIDTGQTPVDTDALAAFGTEQPEGKYEPLAATPSTRARRKKTEKSPARFIIEVFLGGALGLTIGYYALCWILGSQHGLPKLPLPLLPHTMHWFERAEEPGSGPGQPPPEKTDEPKPQPQTQPQSPQAGPNGNDLDRPNVPPVKSPAEQPEPKPEPPPEDYVGPRALPSFTSDELGQALKAAHDASSGAGATSEMTAETYQKFCRMGQVFTFVQGDAHDGRLTSRKLAVRKLLKTIGDQPGRTAQIARLAGALLENQQRLQGGILLAGTAGPVVSQGRLHGTVVRLTAHGRSISVLSGRPLTLAEGDQVIVLGSIVNNPAQNLVGYNGTKPLVVWAGTAVKLAL